MSTMTVVSCDDEPPEPLIERVTSDMNAVTLVDYGVAFSVPVRHLPTVRTFQAPSKAKRREFRAMRSYIWVATLLDNGCALRCFASAWRSSVRSLTYRPPYLEIFRAEKDSLTSHQDLVVTPRRVAVYPAPHKPAAPRSVLDDHKINIPVDEESPSFPRIVITPPPANDVDWAQHNVVPTPQKAAGGNLLTVPDLDHAMSYHRSHASAPSKRGLFSGRYACMPRSTQLNSAKRQQSVICAIKRPSFVEEEDDEVVDLGRTWSG